MTNQLAAPFSPKERAAAFFEMGAEDFALYRKRVDARTAVGHPLSPAERPKFDELCDFYDNRRWEEK